MNKSSVKRQIINWILNGMIIVLCCLLLMTVFVMIENFASACSRPGSLEYMHYDIEENRFHRLIDNYHYNMVAGFEGDAEEQEYYGIAKYYEAAMLYKAYRASGNEELSQRFFEKMQQAEQEMGGWIITKDAIHQQLGIE